MWMHQKCRIGAPLHSFWTWQCFPLCHVIHSPREKLLNDKTRPTHMRWWSAGSLVNDDQRHTYSSNANAALPLSIRNEYLQQSAMGFHVWSGSARMQLDMYHFTVSYWRSLHTARGGALFTRITIRIPLKGLFLSFVHLVLHCLRTRFNIRKLKIKNILQRAFSVQTPGKQYLLWI